MFIALIGTDLPSGTIQPMATADNGTTMTDVYNQQFIGSLTLDGVLAQLRGTHHIHPSLHGG